jgi:hypothetical protein
MIPTHAIHPSRTSPLRIVEAVLTPTVLPDVGGTLKVTMVVQGAGECSFTTSAWRGPKISRTVACGGTSHKAVFFINVPANPGSQFDPTITIAARATAYEVSRTLWFLQDSAPLYPTADGTSQFGVFTPASMLSRNWSGYVLRGLGAPLSLAPPYTAVSANWRVPAVNCSTTPNAQNSEWVGVDGWVSDIDLFQTGVQAECANGSLNEWAWWTDQLLGFEPQFLFEVDPGDLIHAEVTRVKLDTWRYIIEDLTAGRSSAENEPYDGSGSTADWIVEEPGLGNVLADFGTLDFSHVGLATAAGSWTDPPLSDSKNIGEGDQASTSTSAFEGSGASAGFSVTYVDG